MKKIATMGELLIDFVPMEKSGAFEQKFGGAPGNVAATIAILGGDAVFYGAVGKDMFGDFLIKEIKRFGVDSSHIIQKNEARTGITFVTNDKEGNRSFLFFRNPSADMLYSADDFESSHGDEDIFAFSSISLIDYPIKDAHLAIIDYVRSRDGIIVFDANLRIHLWKDQDHYRDVVIDFIGKSDILKVAEEEVFWISRKNDLESGLRYLKSLGPKMIVLTLGKEGSEIHIKKKAYFAPAFKVPTVDTTGAGDAFMGALLFKISISEKSYLAFTDDEYQEMLTFANAVAALSTTKKGAVEAVPSLKEALEFLKVNGSL